MRRTVVGVGVSLFVILGFATAALASGSVSYLSQFGSFGSGDGQFKYPYGVAVDPSTGDVYVTDALGIHTVTAALLVAVGLVLVLS